MMMTSKRCDHPWVSDNETIVGSIPGIFWCAENVHFKKPLDANVHFKRPLAALTIYICHIYA